MQVLLRQVRQRPDGIAEYADLELQGDSLSIGSGADQNIQVLGRGIAAAHATLTAPGGKPRIDCRPGCTVSVAGKSFNAAVLLPGTPVQVGPHRLLAVAAPPGFDLALELHLSGEVEASEYEGAFRTRLEQTWLRKRGLAWGLLGLVLLGTLVLPLALIAWRQHAGSVPPGLPNDTFWTSGPLLPAHAQAIGNDCSVCHRQLFRPVQDKACLNCHRSIHDHVQAAVLARTRFAGRTPTCESCHREHQEPVPHLIVRDNALCVECHGRSPQDFGPRALASVRGFNSADHPSFKVHLLKPVEGDPYAGTAQAQWEYREADLRQARESSNLLFSHQQHLDPKRVTRNGEEGGLRCADCHVLSADGLRFKPITMRDSCVSCHELTFDPDERSRQLPHGKPREVVATLLEYYARRFLDPGARAVIPRVRGPLPGSEDRDANAEVRCTDSVAACSRQAALAQIDSQFNVRGCHGCHRIVDTHAEDIKERYQVLAVKLGNAFYPHAKFSHKSHLIQGRLTGDDACQSCHAAQKSTEATQVLMPGIERCVSCHSDVTRETAPTMLESAKAGTPRMTVPLGCVGCHDYHPGKLRD